MKFIEAIGNTLGMESLTVRQVVDTTQRPKMEDYDDYIFFSIKSISKDDFEQVYIEQLSFVLGKNYLVSFQEEVGDHFNHIRQRMRDNLGLVRKENVIFFCFNF